MYRRKNFLFEVFRKGPKAERFFPGTSVAFGTPLYGFQCQAWWNGCWLQRTLGWAVTTVLPTYDMSPAMLIRNVLSLWLRRVEHNPGWQAGQGLSRGSNRRPGLQYFYEGTSHGNSHRNTKAELGQLGQQAD